MGLGNFLEGIKDKILGKEKKSEINPEKEQVRKDLLKVANDTRSDVDENLEHPKERQFAQELCAKLDSKTKIKTLKALHPMFKEKSEPAFKQGVSGSTLEQIQSQLKTMAQKRGMNPNQLEKAVHHHLWKEFQEQKTVVKTKEQEMDEIEQDASRKNIIKNAELIVKQIETGKDGPAVESELIHLLRKEFDRDYQGKTRPDKEIAGKAQQIMYRLSMRKDLKRAVYESLVNSSWINTLKGDNFAQNENTRKSFMNEEPSAENFMNETYTKEGLEIQFEGQLFQIGEELLYTTKDGKVMKVKLVGYNPSAIKPSLLLKPENKVQFAINAENVSRLKKGNEAVPSSGESGKKVKSDEDFKKRMELEKQNLNRIKTESIEKMYDPKESLEAKIGIRILNTKTGTVRQVIGFTPGTKELVVARITREGKISREELKKEVFLKSIDIIQISDVKTRLTDVLVDENGKISDQEKILKSFTKEELKEISGLLSNSLYTKKFPLLNAEVLEKLLGKDNKNWKKIGMMTHEDRIKNLSLDDQEKSKFLFLIFSNLKGISESLPKKEKVGASS